MQPSATLRPLLCTVLLALSAGLAQAQSAEDAVAPSSTPLPAASLFGNYIEGNSAISSPAPSESYEKALLAFGAFRLNTAFTYRFSHNSGLRGRDGNTGSTDLHSFSPSLNLAMGDNWKLVYAPGWNVYSSSRFADSTSQSVVLQGGVQIDLASISVNQTYNETNSTLLELGRQTFQRTASTNLSTGYQLGSRTGLSVGLAQNLRFPDGAPLIREWTLSPSVSYQIDPDLMGSFGVSSGYIDTDPGINQRFNRVNVSSSWNLSTKLRLDGSVGYEFRKFEGDAFKWTSTPILSLSGNYKLSDTTSLSAGVSRSVSASYFSNSSSRMTSWRATLQQRLFGHLNAGLSYSKGNTSYEDTLNASLREDDSESFNASLSCPVGKHASVGLFYNRVRNSSNLRDYSLTSDQFGGSISLSF